MKRINKKWRRQRQQLHRFLLKKHHLFNKKYIYITLNLKSSTRTAARRRRPCTITLKEERGRGVVSGCFNVHSSHFHTYSIIIIQDLQARQHLWSTELLRTRKAAINSLDCRFQGNHVIGDARGHQRSSAFSEALFKEFHSDREIGRKGRRVLNVCLHESSGFF